MSAKLTVVMPVHNGLPYLDEAIRSIVAQSFAGFELLIGDNGSTDGTRELVEGWMRRDPRIRLMTSPEPLGPARSSNWVVRAADTEVVARMDADDIAHRERLQRQFALLERYPDLDMIAALHDSIDARGRRVRPPDFWRLLNRPAFAPFAHASIMFRRTPFEAAGGYRAEADYWEDNDLFLRMAKRGRIGVIPEVLLSHRHSAVSTRLRSDVTRVDRAVDMAYRQLLAIARGGDPDELPPAVRPDAAGKLLPETYVSRGFSRLWAGASPAVFGRMLRGSQWRFDAASCSAFAWVALGTASPAALRTLIRALIGLRSRVARRRLGDRELVEWEGPSRHAARVEALPGLD